MHQKIPENLSKVGDQWTRKQANKTGIVKPLGSIKLKMFCQQGHKSANLSSSELDSGFQSAVRDDDVLPCCQNENPL